MKASRRARASPQPRRDRPGLGTLSGGPVVPHRRPARSGAEPSDIGTVVDEIAAGGELTIANEVRAVLEGDGDLAGIKQSAQLGLAAQRALEEFAAVPNFGRFLKALLLRKFPHPPAEWLYERGRVRHNRGSSPSDLASD